MKDETELSDTLEFLNETPAKISQLTEGLSGAELRQKPSLDEFSFLENICHLRDLEVEGYSVRIDRLLTESDSSLPDFDGARIAAERDYNAEDPDTVLKAFVVARVGNVEKLRTANLEQLRQTGMLEGVGTITLARLAELMREHDEGHLEDLRILRARLNAQNSAKTGG